MQVEKNMKIEVNLPSPISAVTKRLKRYKNYKKIPFMEKLPIIVDLMLVNKYGKNIQKIYLFGSYAYGEPDENSDIDFFIIIDDSILKYRIEVANEIRSKLWDENIVPCDLLVYNVETFDKYKNIQGIERIVNIYGVLIYERE
jgi:predicted nucleotidyltransferase